MIPSQFGSASSPSAPGSASKSSAVNAWSNACSSPSSLDRSANSLLYVQLPAIEKPSRGYAAKGEGRSSRNFTRSSGQSVGRSHVGDLVEVSQLRSPTFCDLNTAWNREFFMESRKPRKAGIDYRYQMEPGAGPLPVHGSFAKLAPDRIQVNVLNRRFDRLRLVEIAVEPGAFLPETKAVLARPLSYCKRIE